MYPDIGDGDIGSAGAEMNQFQKLMMDCHGDWTEMVGKAKPNYFRRAFEVPVTVAMFAVMIVCLPAVAMYRFCESWLYHRGWL